MATIKSISALVFHVKDLEKTQRFYENLGFKFGAPKGDYLITYVNWFSIEFYKANANTKGSGAHTLISVDNIDEFYGEVVSKGFKPEGEPKDTPTKRREFALQDPDGYKLVFFTKK
jgi:catechol 2,3-dioxygenase-like lactoylglutathione lyase family enzyme